MANRATRCPHCQTSFRVTDSQLATARGRVRCGACLEVFNATENWVDPAPTQPVIPEPEPRFDDNSPLPDDEGNELAEVENTLADKGWQTAEETPEQASASPEQDTVGATTAGDSVSNYPDDTTSALDDEPSATRPASIDEKPMDDRESSADIQLPGEHHSVDDGPSATASEPSAAAREPSDTETPNMEHQPARDTDTQAAGAPDDSSSTSEIDVGDREQTGEADKADQEPLADEDEFDALVAHQRRRIQPDRRQLGWALLCLLAAAALVGQLVHANFDSLAQSRHRNALIETCKVVNWAWGERRCELPPPRNLGRIESLGLNIMSHPRYADSLLIDTVILNRAAFEQPFPQIELVFRNDRGNVVASRAFLPSEYLAGELRGVKLMPIGQSVRINISIADPGSNAVNYEMRFLPIEYSGGH